MRRTARITAIAVSSLAAAGGLVPLASASAASGQAPGGATPLLTGQLLFGYLPDTTGVPAQLAVANADGTGLRIITPSGPGLQAGDSIVKERMSPDGKHLSFIASNYADHFTPRLIIADPDGSNATEVRLTGAGGAATLDLASDYAWSADGAWLYVTAYQNDVGFLAAVHPDGSGLHQVLPGSQHNELSVANATGEISWYDPANVGILNVYSPVTGQTRTLTLPKYAFRESLSPDGKFVAVLEAGSGTPTQIEVVPTDGSPGWLAQGDVTSDESGYLPAWSPDESQLAFMTEAQGPNSLPYLTVGSSSGNHPERTLVPSFNPPSRSTAGTWVPLPAGTPLKPPTANPQPNPGNTGPKVYRDAGADRVQTGIAISQQRWKSGGSARAVVLATSLNYPDALSGGPLAAKKGGPLLLTDGSASRLDPRVSGEIQRVLPPHGTVHVLGGDAAMNPAIVSQLESLGYTVTQYKGRDRADTALQVAKTGMGSPRHVVLATGAGFADALAAGPYAAGPFADAPGAPAAIVLSNNSAIDPATRAFLNGKTVATVGGQAGHAWPTAAKSFSGVDRFDTAARVAQEFTGPFADTQIGIANGVASTKNPGYPDALTGGAYMAESNGPIVLVDGIDSAVPASTQRVLAARSGNVRADIFGGTSIISSTLAASIVSMLHGTAEF